MYSIWMNKNTYLPTYLLSYCDKFLDITSRKVSIIWIKINFRLFEFSGYKKNPGGYDFDFLKDKFRQMTNNRLRFSADKTDSIIIGTSRQRRKLTRFFPMPILNHSIRRSRAVHILVLHLIVILISINIFI